MKEYHVTQEEVGIRLDRFLANKESDLSRSYIQKLISDGYITIGESKVKSSYSVRINDLVRAQIPDFNLDASLKPENIPIDVIFEDDEIIVVNKPAGMVVHPAAGVSSGTLVNAIISRFKLSESLSKKHDNTSSGVEPERPGIVHRIDKGTSGLLVVAKSIQAYNNLAAQVRERSIKRKYIALVFGIPKQDSGTIIAPVGRSQRDRKKMAVTPVHSREAITHFTIIEKYDGFSLVEIRLKTGRTHQIRVHFAYIGHPVVGDPDYGGRSRSLKSGISKDIKDAIQNLTRQALHAQTLGFVHPATGKYMEFSAPIPEDIQSVIYALRNQT